MPDFEIRYFGADGSLALVQLTTRDSADEVERHARGSLGPHQRFEIRQVGQRRDGDGLADST